MTIVVECSERTVLSCLVATFRAILLPSPGRVNE